MLLKLFLTSLCFSFASLAIAQDIPDSAGLKLEIGDRVLIGGFNGYVRVVTHLEIHGDANSGNYSVRAVHPTFGTSFPFGDEVYEMTPFGRESALRRYKSVIHSQHANMGDLISFRKKEYINDELRYSDDIKEGKVVELFSGNHLMLKMGCWSYTAISSDQIIHEDYPERNPVGGALAPPSIQQAGPGFLGIRSRQEAERLLSDESEQPSMSSSSSDSALRHRREKQGIDIEQLQADFEVFRRYGSEGVRMQHQVDETARILEEAQCAREENRTKPEYYTEDRSAQDWMMKQALGN